METSFYSSFWPSVAKLDKMDSPRIVGAVVKYCQSPDHPSLNLERLQGAGQRRLWSIRASQELRVLIGRQGELSVFLRADHHDAIYEYARRHSFLVPRNGLPGLIPVVPTVAGGVEPEQMSVDAGLQTSARPQRSGASIVQHWSTQELARAGFNENEIALLHQATPETLLEIWPNISEEQLDDVLEMSELSPEEWFERDLIENDEAAANQRFRLAIAERGALAGLSSLLTPEELQRLVTAPVEDWMIFLHPDQRTLVERRFNGPARVRGSAGTGKTVVALHRAAALAKHCSAKSEGAKHPSILFTTFVSSLPPVLENLYGRLPARVAGAVDFINVHSLAVRICAQTGSRPNIDVQFTNQAFARAFSTVVRPATPLYGLTKRYLNDEVAAVLKGRGVDTLDDYLRLERTGRRVRFTEAMRKQLWQLRELYDDDLNKEGVQDFADIVRHARDIARRRSTSVYRGAVVDESQDLTLVGLQLIQALVDADCETTPDGLFIVGDGAQKIYPGGFTLAQAGIDVRGNSTVLRVNYRNTREIIAAAMACTGTELVNDLGDEYVRGSVKANAQRDGAKPLLVRASNFAGQIEYVAATIKRLEGTAEVGFGDMGVFVADNRLVKRVIGDLNSTGLHCQSLREFNGQPNSLVKVGTFHRAKGLEFKVVFLLGLSADRFPRHRSGTEGEEEYDERRALEVSELFVAMTRARDGLFWLCSGDPSDVIYEALDQFDEVAM